MPGKRQQTLQWLLEEAGGTVTHRNIPYPNYECLAKSGYYDVAAKVYRELGGILDKVPLNLRPWDMEIDGIAVELDEELHFNRYRAKTLECPLYYDLAKFPLRGYRQYCLDYEQKCLSAGGYGGKWTNVSCERQFGEAGVPGDLSGEGAPRWKQRAFYDFIKDLAPLVIGIRVARLSIWDQVDLGGTSFTVGQILKQRKQEASRPLLKLIKDRVPAI